GSRIVLLSSLVLSTFACDAGETSELDGTGGATGQPGTGGAPSLGGAATASGGSSGAPMIQGAGTITGQYDSMLVTREGRQYIVQNNVWGAGAEQTLTFAGTAFEVTRQTGNNPTNGAPVSYPSVFIGSNYDRMTPNSNLPKQVSSITSIDTSWSHNGGSVTGTYNAAYDVWFSTSASGDAQSPSGGYLMVWLYDPPNAQPIGSVMASGVTIPGV